MIVVADTNIIIRTVFTEDTPQQSEAVAEILEAADAVVVPLVAFCEAVWVFKSLYGFARADIAEMLRLILSISNVIADSDAVLAGLQMFEEGGDFEDGVIQYTGFQKAGKSAVFVSFDRKAVQRFTRRGIATIIPGTK